MVSQSVLERIRARNTNKNGKLKKLKKPPVWFFPNSADRHYRKELYEFTLEIRKVITQILIPQIPRLLLEATLPYPDPIEPEIKGDNQKRNDDFIDDLNSLMRQIQFLLLPKQQETIREAAGIGLEVAVYNQKQFDKTVNSVLGVDVFLEEPWLKNQLQLFSNQNAQLITSLKETELDRVSGIVQRGLQEGSSYDTITDQIQESFGITRRHARLIARDQTSKLNGSLTKLRQQELGITEYVWQSSGDERVRASHRVMDGKTCRWDDPTVYLDEKSGKWKKRSSVGGTQVNPSVDINCRCVPLPVLEGFLD